VYDNAVMLNQPILLIILGKSHQRHQRFCVMLFCTIQYFLSSDVLYRTIFAGQRGTRPTIILEQGK